MCACVSKCGIWLSTVSQLERLLINRNNWLLFVSQQGHGKRCERLSLLGVYMTCLMTQEAAIGYQCHIVPYMQYNLEWS